MHVPLFSGMMRDGLFGIFLKKERGGNEDQKRKAPPMRNKIVLIQYPYLVLFSIDGFFPN